MRNRTLIWIAVVALVTVGCWPTTAQAQVARRPNIVIIWGDDIGQSNLSVYSKGMMGLKGIRGQDGCTGRRAQNRLGMGHMGQKGFRELPH